MYTNKKIKPAFATISEKLPSDAFTWHVTGHGGKNSKGPDRTERPVRHSIKYQLQTIQTGGDTESNNFNGAEQQTVCREGINIKE